MAAKILISGLSNSGKTTLTSSLKDAYVASHDGKIYPYSVPHTNIEGFSSTTELLNIMDTKIEAYNTAYKKYPKTVVVDSVSKIFDSILINCSNKYSGFNIYSNLNKEISLFTDYIQTSLIGSGMNVVILSHAIWNQDTGTYELVGNGNFSKRGGFLAEVDNAGFIKIDKSKRVIHHRSTTLPARTLLDTFPDSQPVEEYSLQKHIELLSSVTDKVAKFVL